MSDRPQAHISRIWLANKLLMGAMALGLSLLMWNLSDPFRLFLGCAGGAHLLEGAEKLLTARYRSLTTVLGWLGWACLIAAALAGGVTLYRAMFG